MDNSTPRGIIIDKSDDSVIVIKTEKRELFFSDYFSVLFCLYGFGLLFFGIIKFGFSVIPVYFFIFVLLMLAYYLFSIMISFKEVYIISISDESIEITNKFWTITRKTVLERAKIKKIDFEKLKMSPFSPMSPLLQTKKMFSSGPYEIPRITYGSEEVYLLKHYNKTIRTWIVYYLNKIDK